MLDSCHDAQERWGGVHNLIDRWLLERKKLVTAFCTLRDAKPAFADKSSNQLFCQILLDYVSTWHFEICEQLVSEGKAFGDDRGLELMASVSPRLKVITDFAVAFNDECLKGKCTDIERFAERLKTLGGQLRERFELEDCLIEVLHNAHKDELAAAQA